MKKVAVVILNWNGATMLQQFLPSVIRHSNEHANIYVADNGSTDTSCDIVEREFIQARLIKLDKNYGFAEGYNLALEKLEEEYFILLNSDVDVTPSWIKPLLDYMDNHPETAACQPKLLSYNNPLSFEYAGGSGGFIDCWGYPFCRGRMLGTVENDKGQYDDIRSIFWATGASLMVRRTDYWENGGLDARFFAHMEEIDFCWRLRNRGHNIACIPQSKVYHVGAATLKKENPHKTFLNFRNNLLMIYKNASNDKLTKILIIRYWLDRLAALTFILKGDIVNAKAVFKAWKDFRSMQKSYIQIRKENLRKTVTNKIPEQTNESLLVAYYLKRKHTFKEWAGKIL